MSTWDDNRDGGSEAVFGGVDVQTSTDEFNFALGEEYGRICGIQWSGRIHLGLRLNFRCVEECFNFLDEVGAKSVI